MCEKFRCEEFDLHPTHVFTTHFLSVRNNILIKENEMVSKNVAILSFLLPISMVIGTSIAIEFYRGSPLLVLAFFALGGVMLCAYIIVLRSERHRYVR
jgi:hypothetical protein